MTATLHSIAVHLLVPTFGIPNVVPDEVECSAAIIPRGARVTSDIAAATCAACLKNRRARLERELGPNGEIAHG